LSIARLGKHIYNSSFKPVPPVFAGILDIGDVGNVVKTVHTRIVDPQFSCLSFFGRDQNYAVSSPGTINSGRRGVLEDLHTLYIVGIDFRERSIIGYAIEYDQGIVTGRDGVLSTDQDTCSILSRRSGSGNRHSSDISLQCLD